MWSPPPYVTGHDGEPLSPECDFFVAPPAEIGPVRTAYTSLKKGVASRPVAIRAALALAAGIVGFLLTWGFDSLTKILFVISDLTRTPVILWEIALMPLWVYLGWRKSRFKHFCTFVGDSGCAHYQCERERSNAVQKSSLRFADAAGVSSQTVRRTKNGVYNGTTFTFTGTHRIRRNRFTASRAIIWRIQGRRLRKTSLTSPPRWNPRGTATRLRRSTPSSPKKAP